MAASKFVGATLTAPNGSGAKVYLAAETPSAGVQLQALNKTGGMAQTTDEKPVTTNTAVWTFPFSGKLRAKTGNSGTISFIDNFGNVLTLAAGVETEVLKNIDLATIYYYGSAASQVLEISGFA